MSGRMTSAPVERNRWPSGSTNHHRPSRFSTRKKPVASAFVPANPPKRHSEGSAGASERSSSRHDARSSSTVFALPGQAPCTACPSSSTRGSPSRTASPGDARSRRTERTSSVGEPTGSSISNPIAVTSVSGTNGPHRERKYPGRERFPTAAMSFPVAGGWARRDTGIAARSQTPGDGWKSTRLARSFPVALSRVKTRRWILWGDDARTSRTSASYPVQSRGKARARSARAIRAPPFGLRAVEGDRGRRRGLSALGPARHGPRGQRGEEPGHPVAARHEEPPVRRQAARHTYSIPFSRDQRRSPTRIDGARML